MQEIYLHPSSTISESSIIGIGTKVWINSQIRENTVIGKNCIIGKDTYIDHDVIIGSGVKIQNGVSVYHGVTIEDNVFIGPNVVFTNDLYPRAFSEEWAVVNTLIKEGASIGANATIVCGNILGRYCMVGAGSVVACDVPDYALVIGNPARLVGYVCKCGYKLENNTNCNKCGVKQEDIHG